MTESNQVRIEMNEIQPLISNTLQIPLYSMDVEVPIYTETQVSRIKSEAHQIGLWKGVFITLLCDFVFGLFILLVVSGVKD